MSAPTQHHKFSHRDYRRMAETGVLHPTARVELMDGIINDMSPIGPFHGGVTIHLNEIFQAASRGRWLVSIQSSIHLGEHSEPQPDIILARRMPDYYRSGHPEPEDIFLLIEVADTSLEYDRGPKLSMYSRANIREVWIVDLNELTIEVYREPSYSGYKSKTILSAGDYARPSAFPDVAVDVGDLLKR
jgi:Uma2 family endonuclease